jgi:hypothetical protein
VHTSSADQIYQAAQVNVAYAFIPCSTLGKIRNYTAGVAGILGGAANMGAPGGAYLKIASGALAVVAGVATLAMTQRAC